MTTIPYIKKKIGLKYLVWLQNSNQYIQLEELAWFIFRKVAKRAKSETIAKEFAGRYETAFDESLAFVKEIRSKIEKINQANSTSSNSIQVSDELNNHVFSPFSVHNYKLGNRV